MSGPNNERYFQAHAIKPFPTPGFQTPDTVSANELAGPRVRGPTFPVLRKTFQAKLGKINCLPLLLDGYGGREGAISGAIHPEPHGQPYGESHGYL